MDPVGLKGTAQRSAGKEVCASRIAHLRNQMECILKELDELGLSLTAARFGMALDAFHSESEKPQPRSDLI
jgi:hypothetical protein